MKKFNFKYSTTVWVLLVLILLLCGAGLLWNVFNLTQYVFYVSKIILYSILILINLFLVVLVISVMLYGKYVIEEKYLYAYFGFIRSKIEISNIVEITHFKKSDKLVIYFKDAKYTVIVISPEYYDDFILAIRNINKSIFYDVKVDGEDTPD